MTRRPPSRRARRGLMGLIVGAQLLVLAWIVASQEINRLLDTSPAVELEIPHALARKDPFRGASVSGRPALELTNTDAALPAERLEPGERVLAFFGVEPGKPPRVTEVTRRGWGADPLFTPTRFSIPGSVQREAGSWSFYSGGRGLVARVGKPGIAVELDLPDSILVEEAALEEMAGPSLVRASLRQGFLGHRYLDDVRLSGRGFTHEMAFAYDPDRDRLLVLAPTRERYDFRRSPPDRPPRSELFVFDGLGQEAASAEITGRLVEGWIDPADGTLWALVSEDRWGHSTVRLAQIGEDGQVLQRGPQILYERILGREASGGALWVLAGTPITSPKAPYVVQRMTLAGLQGPPLGPFPSRPRRVLARDQEVWVLEPERHLITRLDREGRVQQEYRDLNRPTEIALDAGALLLIEAAQTQFSRFGLDGRPGWRTPRFQGLTWILAETGTGSGWVGARGFESQKGGLFRYEADGRIARLPADVTPRTPGDWDRPRIGVDAVWSPAHRRLYVRESQAIVILGADGSVLKRVEGFRYPAERQVRK